MARVNLVIDDETWRRFRIHCINVHVSASSLTEDLYLGVLRRAAERPPRPAVAHDNEPDTLPVED